MKRPKISYGFCALVCLLAWLDWRFCLWFLLCALCHELGHLAAMKLCHVPLQRLTIGLEGAVIQTVFPNYQTEILCAGAGPLVGLILALVLMRIAPKAAVVSFLLSGINLLPLYPLDGGRIFRGLLMLVFPATRAERIIHIVTVLICCVLMLLACWGAVCLQMGLWPIFAALLLLWKAGGRE